MATETTLSYSGPSGSATVFIGGSVSGPSREWVLSKIADVFPEVTPDFILKRLERYDGRERERVQLAVLKLCTGSLDRLEEYIDTAIMDYRDVLAPAEYPREIARSPTELSEMSEKDVETLREQDRQDYLTWLGDEP